GDARGPTVGEPRLWAQDTTGRRGRGGTHRDGRRRGRGARGRDVRLRTREPVRARSVGAFMAGRTDPVGPIYAHRDNRRGTTTTGVAPGGIRRGPATVSDAMGVVSQEPGRSHS